MFCPRAHSYPYKIHYKRGNAGKLNRARKMQLWSMPTTNATLFQQSNANPISNNDLLACAYVWFDTIRQFSESNTMKRQKNHQNESGIVDFVAADSSDRKSGLPQTCANLRDLPLESDNLLNTNSSLDGDRHLVLAFGPMFADLTSHSIRNTGEVDVSLLVTSLVHEGELAILSDIDDLPIRANDNGDGGSVGRRDHILELLAGEDIHRQKVALSVAVLSGLGDGDAEDLAGLSLNHHVSALLDLPSFHGDNSGRSGVGIFNHVLLIVGHGCCVLRGEGGGDSRKLEIGRAHV